MLTMPWIIIIVLAVALDRITKYMVVHNIKLDSSITMIDRFFYLTYIRNTGAAWSMFQNGRYFFVALTPIILIFVLYFLYKVNNTILRISLSLICGGAIGNFIDRAFQGSVVDFLHFYIGSYSFPVFNAADCFVVIGTVLLAYYLLFIYKDKPKESGTENNDTDSENVQ